jgi:hypothetical protein
MNHPRRSNPIAYALYANAALLLAILIVLLDRGRGVVSIAAADMSQPPPIAGGNGIFVMPCQFHPSVWGCYLLDTQRQTLCTYEYRAGEKSLILTAARDFQYDMDLKNFNTFPAWYDIQKAVQDASRNDRVNESNLPSIAPDAAPKDNP